MGRGVQRTYALTPAGVAGRFTTGAQRQARRRKLAEAMRHDVRRTLARAPKANG